MLGIAMWGIRIPFADLLQPALGIDAIWWSLPVSALCSMLMSLAYYRRGNWRQARMLKPDPEAVAVPSAVPAQVLEPGADPCGRCGWRCGGGCPPPRPGTPAAE